MRGRRMSPPHARRSVRRSCHGDPATVIFLRSQLRHQRGRALAFALGVLVAALSFVLLASAARTGELRVRGQVGHSFHSAYDILVRPRGSYTRLERRKDLVRDNYLSGIFGGISFRQYHTIEQIPGVGVAAPIANIGYVLPFEKVPISIRRLVTTARFQLYRFRFNWIADNGLSRYPDGEVYLYYNARDRFVGYHGFTSGGMVMPGRSHPYPVDGVDSSIPTGNGPFARPIGWNVVAARSPGFVHRDYDLPRGLVGTEWNVDYPVMLAAIDPTQEARLVHLDRAVVAGRYLRASDKPGLWDRKSIKWISVPTIASSRPYIGDRLKVSIQRLVIPRGVDLPHVLAAGQCANGSDTCQRPIAMPAGSRYHTPYAFVSHLRARTVATRTYPPGPSYRRLTKVAPHPRLESDFYWSTSPTHYRLVGPNLLAASPTTNPIDVWRDSYDASGYFAAPPDSRDVQFRRLHGHSGSSNIVGRVLQTPFLRTVGRFDPDRLPGFNPLSKVPLETYYPPTVVGADARSRHLLGDKPLGPSQNVGGYIQQPPLLLTDLGSLPAFLNRHYFTGITNRERRAPISVIRVRVRGVNGPNSLSEERIRSVALLIHQRTGLQVDVTAGSSPHDLTVSLPAGRFGRPHLLLREGWVQKGVSVAFLQALDRKDLALFTLILVVCALFLVNAALAAVGTRRREIGTLLTLGWSTGAVFRAVLGEVVVVGLVAGVVGAVLAPLLATVLGLDFPALRALLVIPFALGLALVAGTVGAARAARGLPLDAIRPPVTIERAAGRVNNLAAMALAELRRHRGRSLVGGSGLVIGVAALTILLGIQRAFQGVLVGTLLGNAVTLQVHRVDQVAIGLMILLGALATADTLYLNLRERRAEIVTVQTLGWRDRHIATLIAIEALLLGIVASITGALLGATVAWSVLGVGVIPTGEAAAIAAAGGTAAALLASVLPLSQLGRLTPPAVLAAE